MKKFVFAAAALLILSPAAFAGAYVGASIGQTDASVTSGLVSVDGDDSSWKIVGGYTFMKFVGVEVSYRQFGGISETIGTTTFETDASSIDVFGVAYLPVGPVDFFGKVGYSTIDLDADITDTVLPPISVSASEEEMAYGAGLSFGLGKAAIRVEYEMFDASDDLNMFSAGALWKF